MALSVRNLEDSLVFYKDVFGFVEINRFERENLGLKIAFMKLKNGDDLRLELVQPREPIKNEDDFSNLNILGLKHLCFEVENVDKKYKELKSKGYDVTEPKEGKSIKKYLFVKDPNGFLVEICESY